MAVALAVVLIAIVVAYVAVTRRSGPTDVATGPDRSPTGQLIVVDDGSAHTTLIGASSGAARVVELPHRTGGDFSYAILATGGYFVYVGDAGTWATPITGHGSPRNLGRASYIVPSGAPGRVWLIAGAGSDQSAATTAREVAVDGSFLGPIRSVPTGDAVISGARGGLVLDTAEGALLWNTTDSRLGPTIVGAHRSNLVDVRGSELAWVGCTPGGGCTTLHVADLATGQASDYPAPPSTSGWISTAGEGSRDAFSPDGRHLAVRAAAATGGTSASNVYVIDLTTGTTVLVPDTAAGPYSRIAWLAGDGGIVSQLDDGTVKVNNVTNNTTRSLAKAPSGVAILTTPA